MPLARDMKDFNFRTWESTGVALQADFDDGLNVDVYNSAYSRYPATDHAHFLFPSFYHHYEGYFQVGLCTSRDNHIWFRPTRTPFIPLGKPGAFDSYIISVSPGFVPLDADHYALYYRSGNGPHSGSAVKLSEAERQQVASRISRVVLRRDRLVGIEAGSDGGQFCTRPLQFAGCRLTVNLEPLSSRAVARVQLLSVENDEPIEGFTFGNCQPLTRDALDAKVHWEGRDGLRSGQPLRLHFQLRDCRIYAFQFAC